MGLINEGHDLFSGTIFENIVYGHSENVELDHKKVCNLREFCFDYSTPGDAFTKFRLDNIYGG